MIIADNIVIQKAHQMSCWHDTLDNVVHSGCLGEFRDEDVRCGIGSSGFQNIGNVLFRSLVNLNKHLYQTSKDSKFKKQIAFSIVEAVKCQNPPGRFLEKKLSSGMWYVVCDERAIAKTKQALRERSRPTKQIRSMVSNVNRAHLPKRSSVATFEVQQELIRPRQEDDSCGSCISSLDITTIFDVDISEVGQYSERDVDEWIQGTFSS